MFATGGGEAAASTVPADELKSSVAPAQAQPTPSTAAVKVKEPVAGSSAVIDAGSKRSAAEAAGEPHDSSKRARADDSQPKASTSAAAASGPCSRTRLSCAYSEDKGSRQTMEDIAVVQLDARLEPSLQARLAHFAILDGHGGVNCAQFVADRLHKAVAAGLVNALVRSVAAPGMVHACDGLKGRGLCLIDLLP